MRGGVIAPAATEQPTAGPACSCGRFRDGVYGSARLRPCLDLGCRTVVTLKGAIPGMRQLDHRGRCTRQLTSEMLSRAPAATEQPTAGPACGCGRFRDGVCGSARLRPCLDLGCRTVVTLKGAIPGMRQLDHRGRCTRQLTSEMLTALSWSRQHQEFIQRERIDLPRELRLTVPGRGGAPGGRRAASYGKKPLGDASDMLDVAAAAAPRSTISISCPTSCSMRRNRLCA